VLDTEPHCEAAAWAGVLPSYWSGGVPALTYCVGQIECDVMTDSSLGALLLAGILRLGGKVHAALPACTHHHAPQLPDPVRLPLAVQQCSVRFSPYPHAPLLPGHRAMLHASCDTP
jgi:hypothetical protein